MAENYTSRFTGTQIDTAINLALNHLNYSSSNGLLLGNKTSGEFVGYRAQILSDALNILDGNGNQFVSFKKSGITLNAAVTTPGTITIDPGSTTYTPFLSKRKIGGATYQADFGVGHPVTNEASAQMRLVNSAGTEVNTLSIRDGHVDLHWGYLLAPDGFRMHNGSCIYGLNTSGAARNILTFDNSNIVRVGHAPYTALEGSTYVYGYGGVCLCASGGDLMFYSTLLRPSKNDYFYLGNTSYKWKAVYAVNGTIQTSDRNAKEDILDIDSKYEELFMRLRPVTYKLKGKEHDRTHVGFIAQEVEDAMAEVGLTAEDFAALCIDDKTEYDEETGEERLVFDENGEPVKLYSLRYQEFDGINTHMIQKLAKEFAELKTELRMKGIVQ